MPVERLARYGAKPPKLRQYPGLKEEYYLADFEPDRGILDAFAIDPQRVLVVLRPPPDVSLYHRHSNPLFPQTLNHLGSLESVHAFARFGEPSGSARTPTPSAACWSRRHGGWVRPSSARSANRRPRGPNR